MKKILFLCFIIIGMNAVLAFPDVTEQYYKGAYSKAAITFYNRMASCKPAYLESTKERVFGIIKNQCKYSVTTRISGENITYTCYMPVSVAKGYATTLLDVLDVNRDKDIASRPAESEDSTVDSQFDEFGAVSHGAKEYENGPEGTTPEEHENYYSSRVSQNQEIIKIMSDYCTPNKKVNIKRKGDV